MIIVTAIITVISIIAVLLKRAENIAHYYIGTTECSPRVQRLGWWVDVHCV